MLYILIEDGDLFDGTQDQFRDCFFDNANANEILDWAAKQGYRCDIRNYDEYVGPTVVSYPDDMGLTDRDKIFLARTEKLLRDSNIQKCTVSLHHWERGYTASYHNGKWYLEN